MIPRRHTSDVRTRNDMRAQLAQFLVFARTLPTLDVLCDRYKKLPRAEVARELEAAQERRACNG